MENSCGSNTQLTVSWLQGQLYNASTQSQFCSDFIKSCRVF